MTDGPNSPLLSLADQPTPPLLFIVLTRGDSASLLDRFWRNSSASIRVNATVKSALRPRPHKRLCHLPISPRSLLSPGHRAATISRMNPFCSDELQNKFRRN